MAANQFLSLPAAATGLTPASSATAWGYGSWIEATASTSTNIAIIGFQFEITNVAALDTSDQQLFEIGTGAASTESTKVQIPYENRNDTQIGYYMKSTMKVFLPEPYFIPSGTRVAVRATDSLASAITYNGVKILYKELSSPTTVLNTPADAATGISVTPTLNFTGTDGDGDNVEYNIQISKSSTTNVTTLVVGGGGGGGTDAYNGGGGGAGGYISNTSFPITPQAYTITVGGGGAGAANNTLNGTNGSNSIFSTLVAIGGGGGAKAQTPSVGLAGGSGGGAGGSGAGAFSGGLAELNQGFNGGNKTANLNTSAGGGGAGAAGGDDGALNGGVGGVGLSNSISGSAVFYAGGGGGGTGVGGGAGGAGGNGGGGAGGAYQAGGVNGTANKGGGGGGGCAEAGNGIGGTGGSGVVIISYPTGGVDATGGTITASGGNTIHTFIASGTFTVSGIYKVSETDAGFTAGHPFTSEVAKDYTVQSGDTLANSTTYYWRVRAIDPTGSNQYGPWSTTRSFTTVSSGAPSFNSHAMMTHMQIVGGLM